MDDIIFKLESNLHIPEQNCDLIFIDLEIEQQSAKRCSNHLPFVISQLSINI